MEKVKLTCHAEFWENVTLRWLLQISLKQPVDLYKLRVL